MCYVCSPKPFVNVFVNVDKMTVKEFESEVLKKHLNMVAPDVVLDGKGVMVISSEEGETEVSERINIQFSCNKSVLLFPINFLKDYFNLQFLL